MTHQTNEKSRTVKTLMDMETLPPRQDCICTKYVESSALCFRTLAVTCFSLYDKMPELPGLVDPNSKTLTLN